MKPIRYVFPGLCGLALVSGPMPDALAAGSGEEPWQIVPDEALRDLRGGVDLGPVIGNFAIQRVVLINGEVVARMQIVISNLDRLGQGGMPTVTISGPLAELVQVLNPTSASLSGLLPSSSASAAHTAPAGTGAPVPQPANLAAAPAKSSAPDPAPPSAAEGGTRGSAATVATNSGPHIGPTSGNSGTTSSTATQSGSMAQFGAAISQAVAAANGAASGNASAPVATSAPAAPASASQTSNAPVAAATAAASPAASSAASSAAAAPALASASEPAQSTSRTIQVGNTGEVIVVSNIPNAEAITSAVQNTVQATKVQTLTTISATLNSLQLLSAAQIANQVRLALSAGH